MAVYTRLITPSFGARVEYEDRFAADFQNTIVRRFSRDPAQLRFYAAAHCYPSTYLHARARSRQRGPSAPITPGALTHSRLRAAFAHPFFQRIYLTMAHLDVALGGAPPSPLPTYLLEVASEILRRR